MKLLGNLQRGRSQNPSPKPGQKLPKWLSPNRLGYLLAGGWVALGAALTALSPPVVQSLERHAQVLFYQVRGPIAPPDNIVILAIDEESLFQGEYYRADPKNLAYLEPIQQFPWKRSAYATAIERLMAAGAKTVAIDLIFDNPSIYGEADDARLRQTLQRYQRRVTLAAVYETAATLQGANTRLTYPTPDLYQDGPSNSSLPAIGFINYLLDKDGRIHQLASEYQKQVIAPLGLDTPLLSFDESTLQSAQIPYPKPRGENIFFYGPTQSFTYIPFFHVLDPQQWNGYLQQGKYFQDKIVLIGPTALAEQDRHRTPFSGTWLHNILMPGVEIHANAIATLMQNRAIADALPSAPHRGLLVLVGGWVAAILVSKLSQRPDRRVLLALAIATGWAMVAYGCFTYAGLILPTAIPVLGIALGGLSFLSVGAVSDRMEKLHLRRTLERYVAAPVVREILNQPEDFRALLQGRKLNAAVLFCDIRGFTSLSVKLTPEQLVAQLNTYLGVMVEEVIQARGTVDKFIGDAIMAEFGCPVSQGEKSDALNAIKAALGMRRALADLRQQWQQQGKPPLFNGVGISFGAVIAGNIGSPQRLEYTVIGDTVNTASRVEGLTKELGTDILITDALYTLVQDEIEVVFMGHHALRGRDSQTGLYSVVGFKGDDPTLYQEVQQGLKRAREARKQAELPVAESQEKN